MFHIQSSTFEWLITKFAVLFSEAIFDKFVLSVSITYPMEKLMNANKCFRNFPCSRYAVDVRLQKSNRPSGSLQEGKKYYFGKHTLYRFKVIGFVLPIGIAEHCPTHYPGSVADIDSFYKNCEFYDVALLKFEGEANRPVVDSGPLHEIYSGKWAALADKDY